MIDGLGFDSSASRAGGGAPPAAIRPYNLLTFPTAWVSFGFLRTLRFPIRRSMIYEWPGCPYYDKIAPRNRSQLPERTGRRNGRI